MYTIDQFSLGPIINARTAGKIIVNQKEYSLVFDSRLHVCESSAKNPITIGIGESKFLEDADEYRRAKIKAIKDMDIYEPYMYHPELSTLTALHELGHVANRNVAKLNAYWDSVNRTAVFFFSPNTSTAKKFLSSYGDGVSFSDIYKFGKIIMLSEFMAWKFAAHLAPSLLLKYSDIVKLAIDSRISRASGKIEQLATREEMIKFKRLDSFYGYIIKVARSQKVNEKPVWEMVLAIEQVVQEIKAQRGLVQKVS